MRSDPPYGLPPNVQIFKPEREREVSKTIWMKHSGYYSTAAWEIRYEDLLEVVNPVPKHLRMKPPRPLWRRRVLFLG